MSGNSRVVRSAQVGPHEKLAELVLKHRDEPFLKPIAPWNQDAFRNFLDQWGGLTPLILDSACGVGWSSLTLARQFPNHFVIAVDQSEDRLTRRKPAELPLNLCFVRADLVDFWRLLHAEGIRLERHYILYPNPWPKIGQVMRRWQGHPVFPVIPALGGILECRSNWRIYIEEFSLALGLLTGMTPHVEPWEPEEVLTPFERKYLASGQALYRLYLDLEGMGDVHSRR